MGRNGIGAVTWPAVVTFKDVHVDKAQAMKIVEEACEVHSAFERYRLAKNANGYLEMEQAKMDMVEEISDVMQACSNMLAALGVSDMRDEMRKCADRNKARGRM